MVNINDIIHELILNDQEKKLFDHQYQSTYQILCLFSYIV